MYYFLLISETFAVSNPHTERLEKAGFTPDQLENFFLKEALMQSYE